MNSTSTPPTPNSTDTEAKDASSSTTAAPPNADLNDTLNEEEFRKFSRDQKRKQKIQEKVKEIKSHPFYAVKAVKM